MITECSNCKYYKTDFREEPCKSCISYRYFVSREEAKKEEIIRAEAIKEFAERLCEDKLSNDPVVIAVKAELKMMERESNG